MIIFIMNTIAQLLHKNGYFIYVFSHFTILIFEIMAIYSIIFVRIDRTIHIRLLLLTL